MDAKITRLDFNYVKPCLLLFGLFKAGLFKNAVGYWFLDDKPWLELYTIEEALQTIQTLVKLGVVSGYAKYLCEALLKISSRSNIKKLFKDPHIIQFSS